MELLRRLNNAVLANRNTAHCLRLWSKFIRLRDGNQCIVCGSNDDIAAHHIFRKSFVKEAKFQTGNGISLCGDCHKQPHEIFNGRANLDLPMDFEGGENIDLSVEYMARLIDNGRRRNILSDEFYFFSDHTLSTFKVAQSIHPDLPFPGMRIEQALLIWQQTPRRIMEAIFRANGFDIPPNFIQSNSGITLFMKAESNDPNHK